MTGYMQGFVERGVLRPLDDLEQVTTLIIEMLTWWAMDMRYVSFDAKQINAGQGKSPFVWTTSPTPISSKQYCGVTIPQYYTPKN